MTQGPPGLSTGASGTNPPVIPTAPDVSRERGQATAGSSGQGKMGGVGDEKEDPSVSHEYLAKEI